MKSNNEDKVLMEKLGSLDTLSGGIVYGREEAWEKLQGRLDAKPAKRIVLKYSLAAAILVLLGITGFYFYFGRETVNTKTQITEIATSQLAIPARVVSQPETARAYTSVSVSHTEAKKRNVAHTVCHTSRVWHTSAAPEPQPVVENNIAAPPVALTPPSPARTRMKVVHINELNNEGEQQVVQQDIAANTPGVDVHKLPKVHINDVIHEEYEVEKLLRENRLGTRNQFLLWRDRSDLYENESKNNTTDHQPVNRQRFRIN